MNLNYIKDKHKDSLFESLQKYENMFDGTLGKYKGSDYTIARIRGRCKALSCKAFSYSKNHEPTFMKEVNRLIKIGVLKNINNFQWAAPTFIVPKINGTVRFISDFRGLNI